MYQQLRSREIAIDMPEQCNARLCNTCDAVIILNWRESCWTAPGLTCKQNRNLWVTTWSWKFQQKKTKIWKSRVSRKYIIQFTSEIEILKSIPDSHALIESSVRRIWSSKIMIWAQLVYCINSMQTNSPRKILSQFILFPKPMDRAEVLHAQSYTLELSWYNTLKKNE